jgi:hypothetical protein
MKSSSRKRDLHRNWNTDADLPKEKCHPRGRMPRTVTNGSTSFVFCLVNHPFIFGISRLLRVVTFVCVNYAFTKLISLILASCIRRDGIYFIWLWFEAPTLIPPPSSHCGISQLSSINPKPSRQSTHASKRKKARHELQYLVLRFYNTHRTSQIFS